MIDKSNTLDSREEVDLLVNLIQAEQSERSQDLVAALTRFAAVLAIDPKRADAWKLPWHCSRAWRRLSMRWPMAFTASGGGRKHAR